ncbi:MAG TPA: DNA internalization-related competence protein ComEC/Rec2, partial [Candidatus Hydrogenedentes bacterium]|nr:DNA internalization-related competence protein ComEC/Rec2 [Candidatus Hydrogenedentota bacterium]
FSRTGTAHVLAVSGLHVGLLYLSVASLLGPLRHRRIIRTGLLLAVVIGYALMAGARGSTIRAAGMVAIFLIYDFFRREPDSITCLSLAGCVQLLAAPWLVRDPGFQMSYVCVAALMVFGDLFSEKLRWMPRPFGGVLAATGSVQLLLIPLVGWHFGLVSLAGITANLIAVPLLTVILWLLLFTAALAAVLPELATLFAYAAIPPVWLMESAAELFSRIPGSFLYAGRPSLVSLCCWFAGAMLLAAAPRGIRRRKTALSAGLLLLILAVPLWPLRSHPVGLEVLDTGHADALLLVSPEGETVLVDGGNLQGRRNDGRDIVVPVLSARGITRLDAVIATHADSDHLGGLFSVVNTLPVRKVYVPCPDSFNGKLADQFLAECARLRIPVARIAYPDQIPFSGGTIQVCHPDRNDKQLFSKDNDRSLVLRVSWNSRATALLAGDIEASAEQYLSRRDIRSVLLKAPHHGSNTSSSLPFLRLVSPAGIVISTARENRLPAVGQQARDRLESLGVPVWRTDLDGGLHFSPDSLGFRVFSGREYWRVPLRPVHMTVCANRINAGE